ncbi:hypothetical protein DFH94DRAFT_789401 [Russula ochroleuca]|uniref:Uncharacterized protein n=1 Tax=Russula ochroleuca TaxID=152965 RepID=A0A9P5MP27_9AGAM|nr:hypothetical protein DFH94DRAFT_789401 [Russula ochroleuca]
MVYLMKVSCPPGRFGYMARWLLHVVFGRLTVASQPGLSRTHLDCLVAWHPQMSTWSMRLSWIRSCKPRGAANTLPEGH